MNKTYEMIVLGAIYEVFIIGTANLINKKKNAEVDDLPSININKTNEELKQL